MRFISDNYSKDMTLRMLYRLLELVQTRETLRDERDGSNIMLENLKKEHDELLVNVSTLASCIRDGIEKNYSSWDEWQSIAREVLGMCAPDVCKDLDSYQAVVSADKKGGKRNV